MRRGCALLAILAAALLGAAVPARAADHSANVQPVASIPELKSAISINFIGSTMFVSTVAGVYSFDVSHPAAPRMVGALPMYIWENEDVDVDPVRKRLFISRDPRGFTTPATSGDTFPYGAVHIIDVSNPALMQQLNVFLVPAGHTTTCVNHCDTIWTAGPYANAQTQPQWKGRPIFATDVRDPMNPRPCPKPIDTGRNDGVTDYVHDVQVDARGVAWVSGAGGVRGYWTSGRHVNPLTGMTVTATGCAPVPYAGGGTPESATPSRFMHNSFHLAATPTGDGGAPAPGGVGTCRTGPGGTLSPRCAQREKVLYATEENITSDCRTSGRFVTYDLSGSYGGQGWRNISRTHYRLRPLDTWTPENQPGATGCSSSHYFTVRDDGVTANAFYENGVRFLDVSDPTNIRQIGWWHPSDSDTWAAYWHGGLVYVADFQRGVDILRFGGRAGDRAVQAPVVASSAPRLRFDPAFGYLCPLRPAGAPAAALKLR